jgi:putative DNA primase/helicase
MSGITASSSAILDPKWSPRVRCALLRNGYYPTPTNGKAPILDDWTHIHATEADIPKWETTYPYARNTGILTATTPTIDVDVLDVDMAKTIHASLVAPLIPTGYPKLVRIGLSPKHAVPFRSEQPFPKIATPRYVDENGKAHRVEVLGAGQQFIAYGTHPDTGKPYQWSGGAPWKTPWSSLPILTEEAARKLIADVVVLFENRGWRPEKPERPKDPPKPKPANRSNGDAHRIAVALAERIESLCQILLPSGKRRGNEWRVGSINGEAGDSLGVHLSGEKAGIWCDFAADESERGDALDLVEAVKNLKTVDAMDWARSWLGSPQREAPREKTNKPNGSAQPITAEARPEAATRTAVLVRADKMKPESINWAWKNRFAFGKLAVLAGDPGLGKSTILIELAALHSIGGEFPCGEGHAQQCESLILTAEDGLRDTLIPRLMAAGADLEKIHFLTGTKGEGTDDESLFDLGRDMAALRKALKEHPNIRILIIDPLTAYLGPIKAKENSEVRRVLAPLVKLIEETGVLAIGNNHLNKSAGKALYRVLDSIAFVAVGRTVHLVIKDADNPDNRKFICDKTNIGSKPLGLTYLVQKTWITAPETGEEIETSRISWGTQHIDESADDALEVERTDSTATDDAVEFLQIVLRNGPVRAADIEREAREACLLGEDQPLRQSKPFRSAKKVMGIVTHKGGLQRRLDLVMGSSRHL